MYSISVPHQKDFGSHGSNGRIERAIRSLREAVVKKGNCELEDSVRETIKGYNESYHSTIKCTPKEAAEEATNNEILKMENSKEGKYANNFRKRKQEVFINGQQVRIVKGENLGNRAKELKGRFTEIGYIMECCENDSHLVKTEDGRLVKKRHYDLKALNDLRKVRLSV